MSSSTTRLRFTTEAEDFTQLYTSLEAVPAWRDLPEERREKMHVAAEEAVMNVAKHAFPPGEFGEFYLEIRVVDNSLELTLEDDGAPFDPVAAPMPKPPANLDEAKPGGLGIALMRYNCSDIHYERVDGHNRLKLRFPLDAG